ncbi:MAG: replication initiator protein [Microvirus sp.]|nr:MAG: replication initiator protein [Microvirus sp.]
MPCYHPLEAFRLASGEVVFCERGDVMATLRLPCGRCVGCRLERSRQWAVRITHEARLYDGSGFVTLTYDDAHVPLDGSLRYRDFRLFMRRVRKRCGPTRFFMCGEYGGQNGRPHFHAGLFGLDFWQDRKYFRTTDAGFKVFKSETLSQLWPLGMCEVGDLTFESAAYMARYVMKKVNGDLADDHYKRVDPETGEIVWLVPEFCHMSLRPGIGARWFGRYGASDAVAHDRVVMNGVPQKLPRYYNVLLKREDPVLLECMQQDRILAAKAFVKDTTEERLSVREEVAKARLRFYKRS